MPDYNLEDIPTLDDIIEKDLAENIEPDKAESDAAETQTTTNDPDLFSDESIDTDSDGTVSDETEHQSGDLNDDGNEDDNDDRNEDKSKSPIIDMQSVEPVPQVPVEPISVELMAKNIVNQLMPDLEQKLKHLLQQTLEEKQAEETIKSADTSNEN
jgi:hypothetical protein